VPLDNGLRVQVLPGVQELAQARKQQCAAFIAAEGLLVVWDDEPMHLIERATGIEEELMNLVWKTEEPAEGATSDNLFAAEESEEIVDVETGEIKPQKRPRHLQNSVLVGLTLCLITVSVGAAMRELVMETAQDLSVIRVALVSLLPISVVFTLFFCQVIWGTFSQIFGPVQQLNVNSKFYSAKKSPRLQSSVLPHVTVQCPVYKEGLAGVILPTVRSVKAAMTIYELQGGSANLFINDDGLQLLPEEERKARIQFYSENGIGWTARPRHGEKGFKRAGKFKKASNMNYALMISCKLEDKLVEVQRHAGWTQADEAQAYCLAMSEVNEEMEGRAWMDGNIRIGDYILLIDSDTRLPEDCLLDAVSEMEQSAEVGILQFSSGVMQVVNTYFENGITFFTNLIYSAIRFTVANGDVSPFVGHNAILRWSALQTVSYQDDDGYEKFWSESHVSEDFDMSLRLQCAGYIIRLAAWAGDGFKEGVSLTVYDELARWEKYAYGCNELLFHPILKWPTTGPFTPLFRKFLCSGIPTTSKITVLAYIGTYYAIAAAWVMTTTNYFLYGWFSDYLDRYYVDSWKVWFSILIVFNGLGNIGLAAMRYRANHRNIFDCLVENFKWMFLLAIFLGGLSLHISQAILAHMFEINMTWGATSKEAEFSNFWIEVPRVIKKVRKHIARPQSALAPSDTHTTPPPGSSKRRRKKRN
jgi:cellulose synthase/poly-beta-1,6-N-acetylglucosamine synthase-like glycosyltransferase